ncbi:MAG: hypothetical protein R3F37_20290 [Candidatus Competibacteraceae bacterium]
MLERTVELARARGGFNARSLRAALGEPTVGPGVGWRTRSISWVMPHVKCWAVCAAEPTDGGGGDRGDGLDAVQAPSLKAALDVDWDDSQQQQQALERLCNELTALQTWLTSTWTKRGKRRRCRQRWRRCST